jgi:hypothetical protein
VLLLSFVRAETCRVMLGWGSVQRGTVLEVE